jgi:DNA-binding NtrC family response regulator
MTLLWVGANAIDVPGLANQQTNDVWAALDFVAQTPPDAVVCDSELAEVPVERFLEEVRRLAPGIPVLIRLALGDAASLLSFASRLTRLGAFALLPASGSAAELRQEIERAVAGHTALRLATEAAGPERWRRLLVGQSPAMDRVVGMIRLVAVRRATVLITGESGTGKEMAARALHEASNRSAEPFVAVNCSAIPETLLESELFGHTKGAFTGSVAARAGRFEQAHRGTLFLDEIGELPVELQAKLLRVLQEREIQRLGSGETTKVDVRVVAATNADLPDLIRAGRFREDLYYRLNVVPLEMPPLRRRAGDIPLLARHFVEKICHQEEMALKALPQETVERLQTYAWPGNVRQLENAIETAIAMSGERHLLLPSDFVLPAPERTQQPTGQSPPVLIPESGIDYEQVVASFEVRILEQALRRTNGNKSQAAEMLRLKRTTLTAKLKALEAAVGRPL